MSTNSSSKVVFFLVLLLCASSVLLLQSNVVMGARPVGNEVLEFHQQLVWGKKNSEYGIHEEQDSFATVKRKIPSVSVCLEIVRRVVVGVAGFMSATFVALNLRALIVSAGERWFLIVAGIFLLQLALSVVLKLY